MFVLKCQYINKSVVSFNANRILIQVIFGELFVFFLLEFGFSKNLMMTPGGVRNTPTGVWATLWSSSGFAQKVQASWFSKKKNNPQYFSSFFFFYQAL